MKKILSLVLGFLFIAVIATAGPTGPHPNKEFGQDLGKDGRSYNDLYLSDGIIFEGATSDTYETTFVITDPTADNTITFQNGSGTVAFTSDISANATAWDDITSPDANKTHAFTTYTSIFTGTSTAADQWNFQGLGAFGDVSVMRIEQKTGNPTNGTVLEVISADTDVDALVVTANSTNVLTVTGAGGLTVTGNVDIGNYYLEVGTDPADAGTIRLANAASIQFEADATGTDVNALTVNSSEAVLIGSSGASGVTITPALTCSSDLSAVGGTFSGNISAVDGTFTGDVSVTGTFLQDALSAVTADTTITLDGTGTGGVSIGTVSGTGTITMGGSATLVNLPATVDMTISGGDFAVTDTANADMVTFTNNTMTTADLLTLTAGGTRTSNNVLSIADSATTATTIGVVANAATSANVISVTADALDTGTMLYLDSDGLPASTYYIRAYDGSANDFTVGQYGAVGIAGNASTNVLTVTTGDVQVDDGKIEVDTNEDDTTKFERAQATVTGPVVSIIEQTDTVASAKAALFIDQDTDSTPSSAIEVDTEGAYVMKVDALVAAGDGIYVDVADSYTGQWFIADAGPWLGTTGEGFWQFTTDSAATQEVGQVIRINLQGTGTAGTAVEGKAFHAESQAAAKAGESLVYLDTLTNVALHIDNEGTGADGIKIDVADSYIGQGFVADLGPWLGTAGEGFISLASDNAATVPAGQFMRFRQLGTGQHASAIGGTLIYLEDDATAPAAGTSYAMLIDATNIEAIHVDTGKVLVDETVTATGGISAGNAADSYLRTDTVELSNEDIKALRGTKKTLVAAPGAGNFIEVVSVVLILDYGTNVLTESTDNLVVQYATSGDDITAAIEMTGFIDQAADTVMVVAPSNPLAANAATDMVNNAVELFNTGDGEFGGNAAADTTMTVKVTYRIHAAGL